MVSFPGEKLTIKIIEILEMGIGSLAQPWQIIREGKARVKILKLEKLAIAQAEVEAEEIRQGHKMLVGSELAAIPAPKKPSESDDSGNEMVGILNAAKIESDYLAIKRAINLRKISVIAVEEAGKTSDDEVSDEPIDHDWFARWREAAQDVSNEDMQQLWAKLLSGEGKKPGSFSLQTVSLLRMLSPQQAEWIAKLAPFLIGKIIFKCDDLLEREGITYDVLLEMEGLGLATGFDAPGILHNLKYHPDPDNSEKSIALLVSHGLGVLVKHSSPAPTSNIPIYKVLRPGYELISLGQFQPRQDYLSRLAKFFIEKGYEVFFVDTIPIGPDRVRYQNPRPVI